MDTASFVECIKTLKGVAEDIIFFVSEDEVSFTSTGGNVEANVKLSSQSGAEIICTSSFVSLVG
jgi:hypothetical protein